jgi:hypothetical protein
MSNKQIKNILHKMVDQIGLKWKDKLPEALWHIEQLIKPHCNVSLPTGLWEDMSLAG